MEELQIKVHRVQRQKHEGIMCFLVDSKYTDDDFKIKKHRTEALCWLVFPQKMDAVVQQYKNLNMIIDLEIIRFKKDYAPRVKELLTISTPETIQKMVTIVEDFIRETISSKYD